MEFHIAEQIYRKNLTKFPHHIEMKHEQFVLALINNLNRKLLYHTLTVDYLNLVLYQVFIISTVILEFIFRVSVSSQGLLAAG